MEEGGEAGEEGERCGWSKKEEGGTEETVRTRGQFHTAKEEGGGGQEVGEVVVEARERAMGAPERHRVRQCRMKQTW